MHQIHILTTGFASPNGIAFLFTFIVFQRELREVGIRTRFFKKATAPQLADCDILFIESRCYSHRWEKDGDEKVHVLETSSSWFGVTYKSDKPIVEKKIQQLVSSGVYPSPLF